MFLACYAQPSGYKYALNKAKFGKHDDRTKSSLLAYMALLVRKQNYSRAIYLSNIYHKLFLNERVNFGASLTFFSLVRQSQFGLNYPEPYSLIHGVSEEIKLSLKVSQGQIENHQAYLAEMFRQITLKIEGGALLTESDVGSKESRVRNVGAIVVALRTKRYGLYPLLDTLETLHVHNMSLPDRLMCSIYMYRALSSLAANSLSAIEYFQKVDKYGNKQKCHQPYSEIGSLYAALLQDKYSNRYLNNPSANYPSGEDELVMLGFQDSVANSVEVTPSLVSYLSDRSFLRWADSTISLLINYDVLPPEKTNSLHMLLFSAPKYRKERFISALVMALTSIKLDKNNFETHQKIMQNIFQAVELERDLIKVSTELTPKLMRESDISTLFFNAIASLYQMGGSREQAVLALVNIREIPRYGFGNEQLKILDYVKQHTTESFALSGM